MRLLALEAEAAAQKVRREARERAEREREREEEVRVLTFWLVCKASMVCDARLSRCLTVRG